jgi:hypothetical protein
MMQAKKTINIHRRETFERQFFSKEYPPCSHFIKYEQGAK